MQKPSSDGRREGTADQWTEQCVRESALRRSTAATLFGRQPSALNPMQRPSPDVGDNCSTEAQMFRDSSVDTVMRETAESLLLLRTPFIKLKPVGKTTAIAQAVEPQDTLMTGAGQGTAFIASKAKSLRDQVLMRKIINDAAALNADMNPVITTNTAIPIDPELFIVDEQAAGPSVEQANPIDAENVTNNSQHANASKVGPLPETGFGNGSSIYISANVIVDSKFPFGAILPTSSFSDLTLILKDNITHHLHRHILAHSSTYFAKLCASPQHIEKPTITLTLPLAAHIFAPIIEFLYTGSLRVATLGPTIIDWCTVYSVSEAFGISRLQLALSTALVLCVDKHPPTINETYQLLRIILLQRANQNEPLIMSCVLLQAIADRVRDQQWVQNNKVFREWVFREPQVLKMLMYYGTCKPERIFCPGCATARIVRGRCLDCGYNFYASRTQVEAPGDKAEMDRLREAQKAEMEKQNNAEKEVVVIE